MAAGPLYVFVWELNLLIGFASEKLKFIWEIILRLSESWKSEDERGKFFCGVEQKWQGQREEKSDSEA
jgi:hypothetical protein